MSIAAAMALGVVKFQTDGHGEQKTDQMWELGVLCVLPALLLIAVAHMGLHKYGSSNRLLAFKLYLGRMKHYSGKNFFHTDMNEIGWEEAMRAWRVVNSTLMSRIYKNKINTAIYEFNSVQPPEILNWCNSSKVTTCEDAVYTSGSYLRIIVISLFILLAFNISIVIFG